MVLGKAVDRKVNDVSKCILFSINELSTVSIYCIYVCVCVCCWPVQLFGRSKWLR